MIGYTFTGNDTAATTGYLYPGPWFGTAATDWQSCDLVTATPEAVAPEQDPAPWFDPPRPVGLEADRPSASAPSLAVTPRARPPPARRAGHHSSGPGSGPAAGPAHPAPAPPAGLSPLPGPRDRLRSRGPPLSWYNLPGGRRRGSGG